MNAFAPLTEHAATALPFAGLLPIVLLIGRVLLRFWPKPKTVTGGQAATQSGSGNVQVVIHEVHHHHHYAAEMDTGDLPAKVGRGMLHPSRM